jgi:hypothetical protein
MEKQLITPTFSPCNSCDDFFKDTAFSIFLLASMKAADIAHLKNDYARFSLMEQRSAVRSESNKIISALEFGTKSRLLSDVEKYITLHLLSSAFLKVNCPVVATILGATAAQETVKAISGSMTPINQFWFYDSSSFAATESSGDSGSRNTLNLLYGATTFKELRALKVIVAGAGAIGCELIKNFAMLGVGVGSSGSSNLKKSGTSSSDRQSNAWKDLGLQDGGVIVVDMDSIERSNLHRQMFFRYKLRFKMLLWVVYS